jgi:hypothetical protein
MEPELRSKKKRPASLRLGTPASREPTTPGWNALMRSAFLLREYVTFFRKEDISKEPRQRALPNLMGEAGIPSPCDVGIPARHRRQRGHLTRLEPTTLDFGDGAIPVLVDLDVRPEGPMMAFRAAPNPACDVVGFPSKQALVVIFFVVVHAVLSVGRRIHSLDRHTDRNPYSGRGRGKRAGFSKPTEETKPKPLRGEPNPRLTERREFTSRETPRTIPTGVGRTALAGHRGTQETDHPHGRGENRRA